MNAVKSHRSRNLFLIAPLLLLASFGLAHAEQRGEALDRLFVSLQNASSPSAARLTEREIEGLWRQSGSESIDLLLSRAGAAASMGEEKIALRLLDRIVNLAPEFAEGWNKRATLHYLMGDYQNSMRDIEVTLRLEPRHYGALAGLSLIMESYGESAKAAEAYRAALSINPFLEGNKERLRALEDAEKGRGI
jgi:tetratricopeptide (TPR) repeat protein